MRAREVARRFARRPQQLHAHGFSGKVPVASDLQCLLAFSNDPTAPDCLHGKYSFIQLYIAFMRTAQIVARIQQSNIREYVPGLACAHPGCVSF
jgi:hypothetical protein